MDVFLLIVSLVILVLLVIVGIYLLVNFSHPDDKSDAYFPKFVVLIGFVLAGSVVLLLPLDVANREGYPGCGGYDTKLCGGLNMELLWNIMYILVLVWLILFIPFSTFYYEADDGMLMAGTAIGNKQKKNSRILEALKSQIFLLVIVTIAFIIGYVFLKQTSIPIQKYTAPPLSSAARYNTTKQYVNTTLEPFSRYRLQDISMQDLISSESSAPISSLIKIDVGIITFCTAILAFVGWFFFAIFGGIGMASLPLDLILAFKNRPVHMDAVEMADAQANIQARVNELVDVGEMIKIQQQEENGDEEHFTKKGFLSRFKGRGGSGQKLSRKEKKERSQALKQFKQSVYLLEQDVEEFKACTTSYNDYNPLIPYASLVAGILSAVLSLFWVLQIVLYVLPNPAVDPLLNRFFRWFDSWFPMFGTLSVALFSFYLLMCAVKGCFKFGLRFFFFTLHPMKPNKTYMSSFLFNIALLLLCAIPVVQFSIEAFADYARNTTALQVFGTQIRYMKFFSYFFEKNVFIYAILAMFILTCIYLVAKPRDKATDGKVLKQKLDSRMT